MDELNPTSEKKRRVAIYIRVSTAEQKIDGYSLEAQKKRLTDYVQNNPALNLETKPEWLYTDVHTGSDLARTSLQNLLKDVKEGKYDAVLVWKIDRLSRSLQHLLAIFEGFEKQGVSFISIQENIDFKGAIGKLIFQIFGAIAQFERELIKGRTFMGKLASAEAGNWVGTYTPYGYTKVANKGGKGHRLAINHEQKKHVQDIYDWYIYEGLGYGKIADRLNEQKVPKSNHHQTKRASVQWTWTMVSTILTNELYRGIHVVNRKDESGALLPDIQWTVSYIPECVSQFTFLQAQEALRNRQGGRPDTDYLLSGKLVDMTLPNPKKFVGAQRFKGGHSYRRKQFGNKEKKGEWNPVFEVPGEKIEEYVWSKVLLALQKPEAFINEYLSRELADPTAIRRLEDQLHTLRQRLASEALAVERIERGYEDGLYASEKAAQKTAERQQGIGEIESKISEIETKLTMMSMAEVEVQKLREASEQVKYRLENLDRKQQKLLCNLFVDRVEMYRIPKRDGAKKWKITAKIYFRFNPEKFSVAPGEGRTSTKLTEAKKSRLKGKMETDGGR